MTTTKKKNKKPTYIWLFRRHHNTYGSHDEGLVSFSRDPRIVKGEIVELECKKIENETIWYEFIEKLEVQSKYNGY